MFSFSPADLLSPVLDVKHAKFWNASTEKIINKACLISWSEVSFILFSEHKIFYIYLNKNSKNIANSAKFNINPARILVVRTDRIGDVVLTLPVIDALKQCYPNAEIDFLVSPRVSELLSDYPNINIVHSIEKVTASGIKSLCKTGGYDLAVVVHPRFSIALGLYLGGVKYRLGTGYRWYSFLFNIKHYQHRKEAIKHELEYNLDLLTELNCSNINYSQPLIEVKDTWSDKVSERLKSFGVNPEKFITIHISSLGSAKVWSDENFASLINKICSDLSEFSIILTGTQDDKAHIEKVTKALTDKNKVHPVLDVNLKELAALLKLSKLFIGNSTGPMHIAAAVGTFCVGFYSPVKVESAVRWGPYTEKKKIFQPDKDDDSRNVMDEIKPDEVFEFVNQYLKTYS